MKPIQEFLSEIAALDVKLWVEGTSLRCNAPQGIITPEIRAHLSDRKAEIIKFLQDSHLQLIKRSPRNDEPLPLSWAQQRLWFLNQLDSSSATYNIPAAVRISGDLDLNALRQALSEIVRRHEILRTSFQTVNGTPIQVIHPSATMNINVVDLQQLSVAERETIQKQQVELEAITPFSLEIAPLIRCTLLHICATEYVLLLTMHHIVSDGWSMGVFISELCALYQASCAGEPSPLPELPIQYADFAVWQRQWLSGSILETQLNYWLTQLHGAPELLQLPTDRPRPVVQTYQGRTQNWTVVGDLKEKLQSLSQESGTTLFMTLLAAFATLLYRYSGQSDILIGSPIANRNRSEIESLIGFFVNTLVLRTRFEDNPTIKCLLTQIKKTTLLAYEHQDVPFEQVVEALQPQRSLSHSPLFNVMFVWQNAPLGELELPGVTWCQLDGSSTVAKFDLTLSMSETNQGLIGSWEYNTDLFDGSTIERMAAHFQNLLSAIVENPQQTVGELPLLSAAERHQLLVEWNDTLSEYPQDKCIHQLFEEQVERTPNAVAVVFENNSLTYLQLNQRANQLAHHLLSLGVGPEVLVGICVERSVEMVVGLLGILKAGGAYVPLDPTYPQEHLAYMLSDSRVSVLLTQEKLVADLPEHTAYVVCLDSQWGVIPCESQENPLCGVQASNLAYVIYTSGSTGKPKGVRVGHQGLCNLAQAEIRLFDVNSDSSVLQFVSFSFDVSIGEVVMALCSGARLCLGTKDSLLPGANLIQFLRTYNITHVMLPPSALAVLPYEEFPALRTIVVGGEACSPDLVAQWSKDRHFFNAYGPTESTVCATIAECTDSSNHISIGRPIANTQIYILDSHGQPVPIGVRGELYIGSAGLARGYLNRPELTQEKFIVNPFSQQQGARLYKTGDLARYNRDGNIEFLGRIDHQVKIRGFRIELGEIEAVLNTHPQIQQAVVIATEEVSGNKRTCAYVSTSDKSLTTKQLREFLQQKLPEYMVPSAFVTLDTLPLTPNGKIDKKALPTPDGEITREDEYVTPRTPSEEIIANIFAAVLGMQNVGIHDNFFTNGGHSLLATQLISRLRVAFAVEIPIRVVFESPTIAQLDQTITQLRTFERGLTLPPIQPIEGDTELLPLSWAQQRLWFINQLEGSSATYNIPAAVRIIGDLYLKTLQQALSEIVRRHSILRTSFPTVNGIPVQVIHPSATININVVDLQQLSVTERETVLHQQVELESITPFDLEIAPLIRCSVLHICATEYVLLLTMHHIVSDGWSIGVFISELSALYQASCAGVPSPLPELPIQYADFAVWQRQWLSGVVLDTQLNYWRDQLHGAPQLLQLPTDRPRPVVQTYRGRTQSWTVVGDLAQKLQSLSRESGTTLFMTLLAAFSTLLYRYSGQSDILVGTPIANRNRSEVESLIGFFVNTLVLRTSFEANPSFESLLSQVRETTLKAYEHQDVPFEQVVEALQPQRSLSHSPLFGVMFVLQNAPMSEVELPGITLTQLDRESTIAKFDLTLSMSETNQGLVGSWEYNTDLFDGSTISRMAGHFQNLLSAIVENPRQVVGEIPLLSEAERHQLLVEWNDTESSYLTDKCIHELFSQQVELTPDAIALVFEEEQLTYAQLNTRANTIAHHLQSLFVRPDVLVGLCVKRSPLMVVGLLGILKAGGTYLPLDPAYPIERLRFMIKDAQVALVLTQQDLLDLLSPQTVPIVCLDNDAEIPSVQSLTNPKSQVTPDHLAYVMYTSGSTGTPKGVPISHHSLATHCQHIQKYYGIDSTDRVLQFTSLNFDPSLEQIFTTLIAGATLFVRDTEVWTAAQFTEKLLANGLSVINLPPVYWQQLIQHWVNVPILMLNHQLKLVIVGGEEMPPSSLRLWNQSPVNGVRLLNVYGPTEATIIATSFEISGPFLQLPLVHNIPIGRPLANRKVYILDTDGNPVPIGVPGELHLGGLGLSTGYLHQKELSQEKFLTDPFSNKPGSRLYKTGDLARYLSDGNIEYLGRIDNQVKIRGFRIELGEIEAVLNTHPQIQQAVVIATEEVSGNKRLLAYVSTSDKSLTTNQLREFGRQQLPEYMVPSAFVTLDTLPLTPNGKIDKKALPAPDGVSRSTEYVEPRTAIEEVLTNIWQQLLLKEKVSIHDNFFEIGGDSILSIQVVSRAKNSGVQITPKQIFLYQTIAELARVANTTVSAQCKQGLVTGVAPLTPIQHWFKAQNREDAHHYNQSVLLQIPNNLQSEFIEIAWKKLIEHHDALRLRFTSDEHKQINGGKDDRVPFAVVDLSSTPKLSQPEALEKIATLYQASLNLSTGPIMQVVMFNLGSESDARLLIIIHHLAVDGVSWRILLSDLEIIYQQLIAQKPVELGAKTTAFIDWAEKLNNYAQSETLKLELDYWLNQPWSLTTPIPLDYAQIQQENTVGSAATVSVKLSPEETQTLLLSVNEAYNTQINDILLSALVKVLAEWTLNSTVLIDLEGHGREELLTEVDLSRTVGWFTSLFPVLLQRAPINQPASVIKSIKEQLRAIPNRGIGYGILRYLCKETTVHEKLQTIPTSEIGFNYLGQFDQVQSQTGWKFAPESTGYTQSLKQTRDHLLDINALVVEGELQINWTYSSHVHTRATVENLAQSYVQAIRSIIEHCQSEENTGYTPSDFPDTQLNQLELDELLAPIKHKKIESIYTLSPMQQGMLFHSLYAPESGVYFEQMTLSLKGNINVAAFESAWQKVVDRYSVFRTFFVWENRQTPLQVVLKNVDLPWNNLDWLLLSTTEQQQRLSELLQTQKEQGFPFNQAPLMRCTLIKLTKNTYKFIWSNHHILMDGWCLPIIFTEILSFYEAELTGETCDLPTPPLYRDYIAWLNSQDHVAASEFWRQTLHGFSAPTPLRVNKLQYQNQQQKSDYKELELRLSAEVSRELLAVAQNHHVTLSTIVQAAWALLLSRYSGEPDVVFGVTVSGRNASLSGVENMVGLLINTLPLRVQISPQEQLIPTLVKIQQLMLELQHYSYTPLVEIQAYCEVPGGTPLFESIVVFENYPVDSSKFNESGSLQLSEIEGFEQTNYPLNVVAVPGDELLVKISYDIVRFEEDTIRRILGHLQTIFSAIVENPVFSVGELPLLSAAERHQLLVEWNDTESSYLTDKCIHELFSQQVELTPDAIALVFEDEQLTYAQLNTRANTIAHHLQSLFVQPDVLVGLCVKRSPLMVVGLLGILKAGSTYLPLDPAYPIERLRFMIKDAQVALVLTQQDLQDLLSPQTVPILCLDNDAEIPSVQSLTNPPSEVTPDHLAYVMYTSGSTGTPKGVPISHHSLATHCQHIQKYYGIDSTDRVLQFTSLNFDPSLEQIFTTLIAGATLFVRDTEVWTAAQFTEKLLANKLSVINLPPAYWQQLIQHWVNVPILMLNHQLKLVIVGGEEMPPQALQLWNQSPVNGVRLLNVYGPTEATIIATSFEISGPFLQLPLVHNIPIGRPLANRKVYILDTDGNPVPIGVPGELHLGGFGLSRGYLHQKELTTEKFLTDPFSNKPGSRLYKTGDLARYSSDGNIEFLGRLDNQVKIRGFRIELSEIEAVLNTHPQIQQAVVIATEDISGNTCLVAYVVPSDESLATNQVREFGRQQLPEYMVPAAFVTLDTLPLTPNGKIDKKALPAPDGILREHEYIAPRTPSEEIIANIFAALLNVQNVGIHDNFFTNGGHSLLATQLISRLRVAFAVEITIRAVFESPTVTQLDQTITQLRTKDSGLTLPPIQPIEGDTEQLPLSWAQQRLWFLNQLDSSTATYNIPAAVRISGNLDINALQQALSEIVRRHEILRTSIQTVNGSPIQVIHPSATMDINVVDLQQLSVAERETVLEQQVELEAITPFTLEIVPLIRCSCVQLSATESVLFLTMHHIVSDGWSIGVFIQELCALYQASCAGVPSPLPELPLQYADFAVWQRQWLSGVVLDTQLNYWRTQLHGAPELLQLPTDRPRPVVQTYQGRTQSWTLNPDLKQKLQSLSQESGTTLFMTLLAAFATLLYRYSGQSDILVGTPIANRNRSEIESLIGFFVNTLVLRTRFEDNPSFENLLSRIRETTLLAYEHQDVPFEQVVEALQPQRSLSHSPLFCVMFVWQNAPMSQVELPGVTLTQLDPQSTIAKFDLTLSMSETNQGLVGSWEYNTDLFDGSTISRMAGHFQNLLSAIVENPRQVVSEIPLLSAAERHQLLREWNDTLSEYPTDKCIHQLFEQQVEKTPLSVAVVFENQHLTYLELNQKANQLAHHLLALGVGPEVLVGICVERSVEMVVGLLGILKAGGAYVPLDPASPQERLNFMLSDTQVSVLLTQQHLVFGLPKHEAVVVCLDTDEHHLAQHCQQNPITEVRSNNLAYTIYTSGSTGLPKGVQILHRAVVNFLCAMGQQPGMTADDVLVGVTSFTFDIAVLEIFLPMIMGARLVMAKREVTVDGKQLLDLLVNSSATVMQATPATWRLLLEAGGLNSHPLKILCGGEALQRKLANQLLAWSTNLWNVYGPTETTIWSLISQVESVSGLISIGRPIANTQVYILDRHLQPVPIGVPGELHIGGDGLARGYLNLPQLTTAKFIPNPFSDAKSERLYKTGDLARHLGDGNIEFLGRIDNQVKIRGFRIELGEIEAVLNTHPQIQQAVVISTEDIPGNKRLVAYVVLRDETLNTNQVREFLKRKLPEYMVPAAFVTLDTLPLTPNGKIDRKALPATDGEITREHVKVTPRTPVEQMLADIWADVLHLEEVGILDNFFELGGHSLTAIQAMSQLNQTFQVELPLRHLFSTPTVAELAQTIEFTRQADSTVIANKITTVDLQAEVVLDPRINRGSLIYQPVAEPSAIFLTGATGFLGAFLLAELLQQTSSDIYCLVRAANLAAGKQRLQENLEAYLLWEASFNSRIIPILGNLSQPLLGLCDEQFHLMARKIDLIYHNGALVNHVYPYDLLRAANVQGTEEVLRLASLIKIKPVHFISTTGVFASDEYLKVGVVKENDPLEHSPVSGGYAQSKWVAEKLVMIARDRGLPCSIYRFSRVTWHTQTGVWNPNDLFYRFIKACIQLKSAPKMNTMVEITPVDHLTKALINLSQQPESLGKTFHLVNPHSVPWSLFIHCIHSLGYPLQHLCYDDWLAELLRSTQISTDNALYSFVALAEDSTPSQKTPIAISSLKFDCQNTLIGLADSAIRWPEVDDKLLQAFLSVHLLLKREIS